MCKGEPLVRARRASRQGTADWFSRQCPGAPDRSRTCDLWLRKPTLYPTELRAHESESYRAGRTSVQPRFRGGASHGTMLRFSGGDRRERAGKPPTALVRHASARRTRTWTRNAMHEPDQHVSPIKNWKQLVVV